MDTKFERVLLLLEQTKMLSIKLWPAIARSSKDIRKISEKRIVKYGYLSLSILSEHLCQLCDDIHNHIFNIKCIGKMAIVDFGIYA